MSPDRRALVVDDDAGVRLLVKRILTRDGFDVDMAGDGAEAIEKILASDYAVIVLDLMMPRIDGRGVIRYLSNHAPGKLANVIVMTAFGASALAEVSPPIGRFVEKPFDIDRFLREVNEIMTRRRSHPSEGRSESEAHR
ncbi:MAG TPA: response regulator [Thermoanaerobaculia bacterium]|jgi:DNA-binding response OmpR family regulator|nr:response regulator [Thermoanaerobaculia bacterium]